MMMPLTMAKPCQDMKLVEVHGGDQVKRRLESLGLVPGAVISLINSNCGSPVILAVKSSRLVLGQGVAQKIMVVPCFSNEGELENGAQYQSSLSR
ncbi:MAG: ferrous iron transport protein A [Chloroflexi bacterium]|jgi:Fe2+ transport system protein FeoA|nr:ferrous iron transport protein A [Chloroflexota bacterium]